EKNDGLALSKELHSRAYITLIPFSGDRSSPESIGIYELIPSLTEVSDTFARANEFAEVFGLLRWARLAGVEWLGRSPDTPGLQASTAVLVGKDGSFTFGPSGAAF